MTIINHGISLCCEFFELEGMIANKTFFLKFILLKSS